VSVPYDDWSVDVDASAATILDRSVEVGRVADSDQIDRLAGLLRSTTRPAQVYGGYVDTLGLFDRAMEFAEALDAPVWAAPSQFRLPFPNRHPLFRGVLPAGIGSVSDALADHDLVLVFGAPVFRYHQHVPGEYLAPGTRL